MDNYKGGYFSDNHSSKKFYASYFYIFHLMGAYFYFFILTLSRHIFWIHIFNIVSVTNAMLSFQISIMNPFFSYNSFIFFDMNPNKIYCDMDN
jgi:hypothetical protein